MYLWFLSSSSAIFMFCVSIRALFSNTSFFKCSFSCRQHNHNWNSHTKWQAPFCVRRHQLLVGTCIILWMLWSITAASMLGEGPRVTNAAPGPSSRSLSSCEEIIGKQILLQLHLIPTARLLQLIRVPFFNCLASFPTH